MHMSSDERIEGSSTSCAAVQVEDRSAPRFTLLIRAAKLITETAEHLCVLRDVSATGISVRLFQPVPLRGAARLEVQTGDNYDLTPVWQRSDAAGFQFAAPIDVERLVRNASRFPKRELRFRADVPVTLAFAGQRREARLHNLSQKGAMIESRQLLSLDQWVRLERGILPEIEARVRWREGQRHGLVFDTTLSLQDLASLVTRLRANPGTADLPDAWGSEGLQKLVAVAQQRSAS